MAINCQAHWYPAAFFEALLDRDGYPRTRRERGQLFYDFGPCSSLPLDSFYWDLDHQLATFAEAGIDAVVSSPAGFALDGVSHDEEIALTGF